MSKHPTSGAAKEKARRTTKKMRGNLNPHQREMKKTTDTRGRRLPKKKSNECFPQGKKCSRRRSKKMTDKWKLRVTPARDSIAAMRRTNHADGPQPGDDGAG